MKTILTAILLFVFGSGLAQTNEAGSFVYKSILRDYIIHLPPSPSPNLPLVINLHGLGSEAWQQQLYTQFDVVADSNDFIVVYPNAVGGVWDTVFPNSPIDDVGFISALIDTLDANYSIDTNRVYATGFSMGSYMSYRLACELNDRIAAIGSVAGLMTDSFFYYCDPVPAIPVLHMHGTADPTIPYQGDSSISSVDDLIQYWVRKNNCPVIAQFTYTDAGGGTINFISQFSEPVVTQLPDIDTSDNSTVTKSYYGLCQDSVEVVLYTINGGEHTWPGAPINIGITNKDINASVEIWDFFKRHQLDTTTSLPITPMSWLWNFGDGSASDTTQNPNHQYTTDSTYYVCFTVTNSFDSDTYCDSIIVSGTIGINKTPSNQEVKLFPNPFSENVNVKINAPGVKSLVIFNLLGEKVFELKSKRNTVLNRGMHVLSTGHLDNGIYFLRVEAQNDSFSFKIIKQN